MTSSYLVYQPQIDYTPVPRAFNVITFNRLLPRQQVKQSNNSHNRTTNTNLSSACTHSEDPPVEARSPSAMRSAPLSSHLPLSMLRPLPTSLRHPPVIPNNNTHRQRHTQYHPAAQPHIITAHATDTKSSMPGKTTPIHHCLANTATLTPTTY